MNSAPFLCLHHSSASLGVLELRLSILPQSPEMNSASFRIAAVVVTYRRELELVRLLQSIEASTVVPDLVLIIDHAAQTTTQAAVARIHLNTIYVASPENLGPGAGWKRGMETALEQQPETTHFLILDDDVVLPENAIAKLIAASVNAAITCPILLDSNEQIWGFPEPVDSVARRTIREVQTSAECMQRLGHLPLPFCWCTGACVLVRRDAVDAVGFYRTDFWMLGEDLEYSMRVAAYGGGLFLPDVFVPHLPPAASDEKAASAAHRRKFESLLQNLAYLAFHHPNSRHLKFYLPGNARRYFGTFGWNLVRAGRLAQCLWKGAIRARPAGVGRKHP